MRPLLVSTSIIVATFALLAWAAPLALAGGGCHPSGATQPAAATGSSLTVRIDGCTFLPAIDRVEVGTRVTFANTSGTPHDVSGADYAWRSPTLEPGDTYSWTFNELGLHPYSCSLHPGMAGLVEVVSAAAAADSPAPTADGTLATGNDPGSPGALATVAAGGFGLALGAVLATLLGRRRDRPA